VFIGRVVMSVFGRIEMCVCKEKWSCEKRMYVFILAEG
jgi:hypothetical protein